MNNLLQLVMLVTATAFACHHDYQPGVYYLLLLLFFQNREIHKLK